MYTTRARIKKPAGLTPKEFAEKMGQIKQEFAHDTEVAVGKATDLMTELLVDMGYQEGVQVFDGIILT